MAFRIHNELLECIRGHAVSMPDFRGLIARFPKKVNPNYKAVIPAADSMADSLYMTNEAKKKQMKTADFSLLTSYLFPEIEHKELEIVTLWSFWLFIWDDEIDDLPGKHTFNLESGSNLRSHTLQAVKASLGLGGEEIQNESVIVDGFRTLVAPAIRNGYEIQQREMFYEELAFNIGCLEKEQATRLNDIVPSLEEYCELRHGTSAVGSLLATLELAHRIKNTCKWTDDPQMRKLWDDTVEITWILNDIISMKREIAADWLMNLVSLTFVQNGGSLQQAIDKSFDLLLKAIDRFECTSAAVFQTFESDSENRVLILGLRDIWVGTMYWHFETSRYGLQDMDFSKGSFEVVM